MIRNLNTNTKNIAKQFSLWTQASANIFNIHVIRNGHRSQRKQHEFLRIGTVKEWESGNRSFARSLARTNHFRFVLFCLKVYYNCLYWYCSCSGFSCDHCFFLSSLSVCASVLFCFVFFLLFLYVWFAFLSSVQPVECHANAREQRSQRERTWATYTTHCRTIQCVRMCIARRMLMLFSLPLPCCHCVPPM